MRASASWKGFKKLLDKAVPIPGKDRQAVLFDSDDDETGDE
jgi:hypothetical protein